MSMKIPTQIRPADCMQIKFAESLGDHMHDFARVPQQTTAAERRTTARSRSKTRGHTTRLAKLPIVVVRR